MDSGPHPGLSQTEGPVSALPAHMEPLFLGRWMPPSPARWAFLGHTGRYQEPQQAHSPLWIYSFYGNHHVWARTGLWGCGLSTARSSWKGGDHDHPEILSTPGLVGGHCSHVAASPLCVFTPCAFLCPDAHFYKDPNRTDSMPNVFV